MFQKARKLIFIIGMIATLTACSNLPGMHKTDIIQGNYIEEKRLNNIEQGMSQHDVQMILGTPLVSDSYHDDVWYYVYQHHKSNGEMIQHRQVKIYFDPQQRVDRIDLDGVFADADEESNAVN